MTPHILANIDDFAKTVIMPGDPLRSKMIAETFLQDAKLVNNVRGIQGYTGYYKGKKVSVMASGMGNPSMGIYSYELFNFFNVENIIRVGSAGALTTNLKLKDLVLAQKVYTSTNYDNFYVQFGAGFIEGSDKLINLAKQKAKELNFSLNVGNTFCSDTFYTSENQAQIAKDNNLLAVEMEGAALYLNAKKLNKNALVICTISDNVITGEQNSPQERQNAYLDMIKLALEMAISL